jgi:5-methylcytosine-specific restriction endonuclease McrA
MPKAAPKACRCGAVVPAGTRCPRCNAERRANEKARPGSRQRGYDRVWQRLRDAHLAAFPMCVMCGAPAVDVDHIIPIARAPGLRLDPANFQSLCRRHHNLKTAREREERRPGV